MSESRVQGTLGTNACVRCDFLYENALFLVVDVSVC